MGVPEELAVPKKRQAAGDKLVMKADSAKGAADGPKAISYVYIYIHTSNM